MSVTTLQALAIALFVTAAPAQPEWEGSWRGSLEVPGGTLTLVLHLDRSEEGELTGSLDSPDQGAFGLPVGSVVAEENQLRVEMPAMGASFTGERVGPDEIRGEWSQGGLSLPLAFERMDPDQVADMGVRPQDPVPPFPYRSEDVSFLNEGAGIRLAGTLTLPDGSGPFPAAVLITGSGPQDRDETLLGHRPFLVLSDHLTRAGIAVLRFDDRGVGESEGDFPTATSTDFAGDVEAAIDLLLSRSDIDPGAVGLIGHSEGGLIAPMVGTRRDDVAFMVLMAGPGLPGHELLALQGRALLEAMDLSPELVDASQRIQAALFDLMMSEEADRMEDEELLEEVERLMDGLLDELSPEARTLMGVPEGTEEAWKAAQGQASLSPWMREFLRHDPRHDLRRTTVPVLALNGSLDLQVPPEENLSEIGAALAEAGNEDVTLLELPRLNHLFQTAETGHPSEYASIEETLAPEALEAISSWILARFPSPTR